MSSNLLSKPVPLYVAMDETSPINAEWVPSAKTGKIASSKPPPKKKAAKPPPSRRTGKTGSATGKRGAARGAAVKVKVETEAEEVVEVKTEREAETEAVKIKTEVSEEDCPPRKRALTLRSSRKENTNTAINSKKIKVEEGKALSC